MGLSTFSDSYFLLVFLRPDLEEVGLAIFPYSDHLCGSYQLSSPPQGKGRGMTLCPAPFALCLSLHVSSFIFLSVK